MRHSLKSCNNQTHSSLLSCSSLIRRILCSSAKSFLILASRSWSSFVRFTIWKWNYDFKRTMEATQYWAIINEYQLTASEAVEATLTWPKTSAVMSLGCMQNFNLLVFKLRPLLTNISWRPRRLWRPASRGQKLAQSSVEAACKISTSQFWIWGHY